MLKDERLKAIVGMIRNDVTVCDVGTDHAYIPIELILTDVCDKCIITDISAPSLAKGVSNAQKNGCADKISAYCTNGTLNVPLEGAIDFIIAGMGGELISEILWQDVRLQNPDFRFVLQPMSKADELRLCLAKNGFEIITEIKAESMGRIYPVINAKYTGKSYAPTEAVILLGFERAESELEKRFAVRLLDSLENKLCGIKSAEKPDNKLIEKIENQIIAVKKSLQ